jgi:hypothetical protein
LPLFWNLHQTANGIPEKAITTVATSYTIQEPSLKSEGIQNEKDGNSKKKSKI